MTFLKPSLYVSALITMIQVCNKSKVTKFGTRIIIQLRTRKQ